MFFKFLFGIWKKKGMGKKLKIKNGPHKMEQFSKEIWQKSKIVRIAYSKLKDKSQFQ